MNTFLPFLLMLGADLRIDHVSVSGTDLKSMQAKLASVGIPSVFGGPHSNGATQMAVASLPDGSYIELIALQANPDKKALADHYWSKQMLGNAGPTAWAVRSNDVAAEVARLKVSGVSVHPPSRSGRTKPDGFRLDWETARVGDEPNCTFFPFLIRDFTPREARVGKPSTHEYSGIKHVVIAVRDLKASVARFRQAYDFTAPIERDDHQLGAHLAGFLGTPVILAVPLTEGSWLTLRIQQFGEGPCAFVLGKGSAQKTTWLDSAKLGWRLGFERP